MSDRYLRIAAAQRGVLVRWNPPNAIRAEALARPTGDGIGHVDGRFVPWRTHLVLAGFAVFAALMLRVAFG
jgi:hypothetical protein